MIDAEEEVEVSEEPTATAGFSKLAYSAPNSRSCVANASGFPPGDDGPVVANDGNSP